MLTRLSFPAYDVWRVSFEPPQEFFKKIKFKYLEQEAKETFLKLILADDPEQIDREDNDRLEVENRRSKDVLKAAKVELGGLKEEVERVAEEVAESESRESTRSPGSGDDCWRCDGHYV
jgi:hypothetical protein